MRPYKATALRTETEASIVQTSLRVKSCVDPYRKWTRRIRLNQNKTVMRKRESHLAEVLKFLRSERSLNMLNQPLSFFFM